MSNYTVRSNYNHFLSGLRPATGRTVRTLAETERWALGYNHDGTFGPYFTLRNCATGMYLSSAPATQPHTRPEASDTDDDGDEGPRDLRDVVACSSPEVRGDAEMLLVDKRIDRLGLALVSFQSVRSGLYLSTDKEGEFRWHKFRGKDELFTITIQ